MMAVYVQIGKCRFSLHLWLSGPRQNRKKHNDINHNNDMVRILQILLYFNWNDVVDTNNSNHIMTDTVVDMASCGYNMTSDLPRLR